MYSGNTGMPTAKIAKPTMEAGDDVSKKEAKGPRTIVHKFASSTSMFFLPKAITGKTSSHRYFWAFVFIVVMVILFYNLVGLLMKYFSFPVKMTTKVIENDVPFPHVTLCNIRMWDENVVKTFEEYWKRDRNITDFIFGRRTTDNDLVNELLKYHALYDAVELEYGDNPNEFQLFEEIFSFVTMNANMDHKSLHKNSFVLLSHLAGDEVKFKRKEDANKTDISHFYFYPDAEYYRCAHFVLLSEHFNRNGMDSGWSAIVRTGSRTKKASEKKISPDATVRRRRNADRRVPNDMSNASSVNHPHALKQNQKFHSGSDGFRVVIDDPYAWTFPALEGFDVPPRSSVSFAVRPRRVRRLGWPYSDCTVKNPYADDFHIDELEPYSFKACQQMCVQKDVIQKCGCYDAGSLPDRYVSGTSTPSCQNKSDYPIRCAREFDDVCRSELLKQFERIKCAENETYRLRGDKMLLQECRCYPPCNETLYDISYSMSRWPADGDLGEMFMKGIVDGLLERSDDNEDKLLHDFLGDSIADIVNDFARINVYLADYEMVEMVESADYEAEQLISDIGGQLGLWVGMGVVTVAEALTVLWQLCRYCKHRSRRLPQPDV